MSSSQQQRRARLLDSIRQQPGPIRTKQVMHLYRANGWGPSRTTARRDLQALARRGVLVERGPDNDRFYTLNRKGVRP